MLDPEVLSEVQANQAQLHNAFSVSYYAYQVMIEY
jgi:hypothetical protein